MARLRELSLLEALLRRHTWFTEGTTSPTLRNSGTLGEGWLQRHGHRRCGARVQLQLDCGPEAVIVQYPLACADGAGLARVFHDYFEQVNP